MWTEPTFRQQFNETLFYSFQFNTGSPSLATTISESRLLNGKLCDHNWDFRLEIDNETDEADQFLFAS